MRSLALAAGLLATGLMSAGAQPAAASYAPTLSIALRPATADTAAAVTSTVTQAQDETPNKSIRIHYPFQFGFNPGFAVSGCTGEAERTDSCPPDSQIGEASAQTVLGTFSGPVYFTSDFRLLIYLRGPAGTLQQKYVGYFQLASDGGVDVVLDNLPDFSATSSTVTLEPGPRSLLLTPAACGTYPIVGHFTSQNGEQATAAAQVRISGCDSQPYIDDVWLTPGKLHWDLSAAGSRTKITLQRLTTTKGMQIRKAIWSRIGTAAKGSNSMRFKVATGRARLRRGQYRFVVSVFSIYGRPADTTAITFKVK